MNTSGDPDSPVDESVEFLTLEDLLAAGTASQGHEVTVLDYGLLESALARPRASVFGADAYPTIHGKAAALLESLVKNHALEDGNKRLALVSVRLFYALNDYRFVATDDDKFDLVLDIATDRLTGVAEIAARLEQHATRD